MERKRSLFFSLNDRECGYRNRTNLQRNASGSEYLMKRLQCERVFVGHQGCVNTVAWNDRGDILLSGSDDCKLNIYSLSSVKPVQSIQSGHHANIFSAKFLPFSADTKIASCSGDGGVYYNDVNNPSSYGANLFHCHTGTTYEVNTTPGEPHTFMSSGEDGTVRLFDLRKKSKCSCDGCSEDVLIDCQKAVTSFSVNPIQPFYVAVGCENSLLKVYDRRSLATDDLRNGNDKQRGLVHQFKPKAFEKRQCRVTSLKYSSDGRNLLASYCSDYVYLFNSNPKHTEQKQSNAEEDTDGPCPNSSSQLPMKRLRLRGDWSDTGPNARPVDEEPRVSEDSFVQRMSGFLTRWIEDSVRARRERRRHQAVSRERPEGNTEDDEDTLEPSDDGNISETDSDEFDLGEQRALALDGHTTEHTNDVIETRDDVMTNANDVSEGRNRINSTASEFSNNTGTDILKTDCVCKCKESSDLVPVKDEPSSRGSTSRSRDYDSNSHDDERNHNTPRTNVHQHDRALCTCQRNGKSSPNGNESCDQMTSDDEGIHDDVTSDGFCGDKTSDTDPCEKRILENEELERDNMKTGKPSQVLDPQANEITEPCITRNEPSGIDSNEKRFSPEDNARVTIPPGTSTRDMDTQTMEADSNGSTLPPVDNTGVTIPLRTNTRDMSTQTMEVDSIENSSSADKNTKQTVAVGTNTRDKHCQTAVGESSKHSLPSEDENTRVTIPLGTNAQDKNTRTMQVERSALENRDDSTGESSRTDVEESNRNAAASTIQNFFRYRVKKDFHSVPCNVPLYSDVQQVYRGHRNSRTMIKEANFWGDDFILSGSDCGRIFIWSRQTAELVMLLDGDRHVVNCVQPHPSVPILATSGIDYDIKLWTPTASNVCPLENAKEVIARNEKMLRESRDTVTIPASFMIRVLSSLHRIGRDHGGDQSSGDSDSDLDEN